MALLPLGSGEHPTLHEPSFEHPRGRQVGMPRWCWVGMKSRLPTWSPLPLQTGVSLLPSRGVGPTPYLIFSDTILTGEEGLGCLVTNLQRWKSRLFTQLLLEGV